jgi:hypothetical protein
MKNKPKAGLVRISDALDGFEKLYEQELPSDAHGVWAEPQLYLLPFCVPQDRLSERFRSIKISESVTVNDQVKHRSFVVNPHPELGLPGSFELEVMTGLYKIADEYITKFHSVPDVFDLGSFRSFLTSIGRPCTGKYVGMLKEALKRLAATTCISEGFFYSKPRDLYIIESFTFITSLQIAGEHDFNGNKYESTQVRLHEFIRENLNSNFRTLIDFEYLRSLRTSVAKPLALHLAYRVFKNAKCEWTTDYDWLADRMALKVYTDLRRAKEQLKPALQELKDTGFIESWEWQPNTRIKFVAGPRLIQMHKERVAARDAWLLHQEQQTRKELPLPRSEREAAQRAIYDPLNPLCAEYSFRGWTAVAEKAKQLGVDEDTVKRETVKRGLPTK